MPSNRGHIEILPREVAAYATTDRAELPYYLSDCVPYHRLSPAEAIRCSGPIKTVAATCTRA
jgi:hypothetical protein